MSLDALYRPSLALLTDLYQLTMAHGYWRLGLAEREAVFHLNFRRAPFGGGYAIAAGLQPALELLEGARFEAGDLAYLATLSGNDGGPLFDPAFLDHLAGWRLRLDVDAIPEGTPVFAHEPLLRVRGPLLDAQIFETPLLNLINFSTLIATKAARVCSVAGDRPVLEFGLRRAQGIDGALLASRAAYLGGCAATSNVLAGRLHGIPVKGTHAHAWVMAFADEREAFEAYAQVMPNNCVFLVDTYDTLQGVDRAIEVGRALAARGHRLAGIRLDSGDLAYLSIEARKRLDAAGFTDAAVVASNDLDEHLIESLDRQGAQIGVFGVGTKLATAYDQPALGGVYKLSAIRNEAGVWEDRVKLSEQAIKVSNPGILQVRRYRRPGGELLADMIYDERRPPAAGPTIVDPLDPTRRKHLPADAEGEELLQAVLRDGRIVGKRPSLDESRARCRRLLAELHPGVRRFEHPHQHPVGLERSLYEHKTWLVLAARGETDDR
jgi:nicotinate phosphoribosyltransferase